MCFFPVRQRKYIRNSPGIMHPSMPSAEQCTYGKFIRTEG